MTQQNTFPFFSTFLYRMFLAAALSFFCTGARAESPAEGEVSRWLEVEIGIIGVASVDILQDALKQAEEGKFAGVLVVLDTPGGSLEATRTMVKDILSTRLPLVVWVGPSGARAASAGAFITLAAPIAALSPGANIGAAHPIQANGKNLDEESDLQTKVENDTVAFMDSIAAVRARNKEMARSFVVNSLSVSADEALKGGVIDLIAPDLDTLLKQIDGRKLSLDGGRQVTLATAGATRVAFEKSFGQTILETLSNPNLFYLLFIIGLVGLGFELTHPGTIVPGVIGALALILALIATSVLPINFGAMLLIVASVAFMVAEVFLPSFGALGIGGFIGFIVGSTLLVDKSRELGLAISWWSIVPGSLVLLAFMGLASWLILRNQRSRVQSGSEGLLGLDAEALEDFILSHGSKSRGQVRLLGEIWNAEEASGFLVSKGELVKVGAVQGLTLKVNVIRT